MGDEKLRTRELLAFLLEKRFDDEFIIKEVEKKYRTPRGQKMQSFPTYQNIESPLRYIRDEEKQIAIDLKTLRMPL